MALKLMAQPLLHSHGSADSYPPPKKAIINCGCMKEGEVEGTGEGGAPFSLLTWRTTMTIFHPTLMSSFLDAPDAAAQALREQNHALDIAILTLCARQLRRACEDDSMWLTSSTYAPTHLCDLTNLHHDEAVHLWVSPPIVPHLLHVCLLV